MNILVISAEVWRDDTNGGNVLSNMFQNFDNASFAQIYLSQGKPYNNLCKNYFQITDKQALKGILNNTFVGKVIKYDSFPNKELSDDSVATDRIKFYNVFKKINFTLFKVMREWIFLLSKWKSPELEDFILSFKPDIIFAPCYASHIMLKIDRYVKKLVDKPMISYISDDNYSLKHFAFSPVYWINRFVLRKNMRKTFKCYDLTYTMTKEQLNELTADLKCNMKILNKSADFSGSSPKESVGEVIRLIYAGGIYLNRWKVLGKIATAIKEINKDGKKFELNIYTNNVLNKKQEKLLNDKENSVVYKAIPFGKLKEKYKKEIDDLLKQYDKSEKKFKPNDDIEMELQALLNNKYNIKNYDEIPAEIKNFKMYSHELIVLKNHEWIQKNYSYTKVEVNGMEIFFDTPTGKKVKERMR